MDIPGLVHDELSIRPETKGTKRTKKKDSVKRSRMVADNIVDLTLEADVLRRSLVSRPQASYLVTKVGAKYFPFMAYPCSS